MDQRVRVLKKGPMGLTMKRKHILEQEKIAKAHFAHVEAHGEHRKRLHAIKDKLDLFGDRALNRAEAALVERHREFFYPGRRTG